MVLKHNEQLVFLTSDANPDKPKWAKPMHTFSEFTLQKNISTTNGGRPSHKQMTDNGETVIILGHRMKEPKHVTRVAKRIWLFAKRDPELMEGKDIHFFGQGASNDVRQDMRCFLKKRKHDCTRPKEVSRTDKETTEAISHVAKYTDQSSSI